MYKGVVTGIAFKASQTNAEATADLGNLTTLMEDGARAAVVSWLIPDRANAPVDLKIEQIGFRTKEGGKHAEVSFKDVAGVGVELKHVSELYLPDVVKGWLTKKVFSSNLGIVMFVQYSNGTTRYPASGTTPLLIAIDNDRPRGLSIARFNLLAATERLLESQAAGTAPRPIEEGLQTAGIAIGGP